MLSFQRRNSGWGLYLLISALILREGEQRAEVTACQLCVFCSPSENTLLIGFRYLQNDLFNGITTRIMILFMREAIQALRQADNAFPALWRLMLCYRGR